MSFQDIFEDAIERQYMKATYRLAANPIRIGERRSAYTAFEIHKQLEQEEKNDAS